MRNLKKILAMVLALVMAMSLLTVANAADFSDDAKISYKEAVDVMVAIGVIDGMDDGSFDPNGILTREQAAKLICTMLLGDGADKLGTNKSSFTDVAATRWSSPYIEYCVENGIIAGNGDGTFNPTGKLTGHAFAKLLLCALGYDATTENYVGSSWAVNVASAAIQNGINIDDVPLNAELTREQAAQMAFNTLTAVLVDYKGGTNVSTGDTTVVVDAERYTVTNLSGSGYKSSATPNVNDGYMQFCEQYFTKLKLDVDTDEDNFGRTANTWVYDNDEVGKYSTGDAAFTYTAEMDAKDVESDLKGYTIETSGETPVVNGAAGTPNASDSAADIAALTGNGRLVEIYATGKKVTKVVVINSVLAEVTKVDTKNEKNTYVTVASEGGYATASKTFTVEEGYGAYEKGDMVILTVSDASHATLDAAATVESVYAATEVTGLATVANGAKLTVDGTVYKSAKNIETAKKVDSSFGVSAKYNATLLLDQYGYIVSAEAGEAAASDKTFAVLKAYQTLNSDGELVYMAQVADSTGTVKAVQVAADATGLKNKVATWSEDDGVYTLTEAVQNPAASSAPAYQGSFTLTSGTIAKNDKKVSMTYNTSETGTYYFASNVQFIYVNDGKVTVESGVQKVAGKTITCVLGAKDSDDVPMISAVYVLDKAPSTTTTSDDVIFVKGTSTGTISKLDKDGDPVTYYTYEAYLNGEEIENFYSTKSDMTTTGFFKYAVDDETGAYDLSDSNKFTDTTGELAMVAEVTVSAVGSNNNVLTANRKDYTVGNAVVVDITDNDITSVSDIKSAMTDDSKTVKVMMIVDEETMVAQYIYVTSVA